MQGQAELGGSQNGQSSCTCKSLMVSTYPGRLQPDIIHDACKLLCALLRAHLGYAIALAVVPAIDPHNTAAQMFSKQLQDSSPFHLAVDDLNSSHSL